MYQQIANSTAIKRLSDNATIPVDSSNTDYQEFLEWQVNGGEIAAAEQPTIEQQRAQMVLTPAQARLKLASIDLLTSVNAAINALAETDAMRIKWEYATQIERLDPDLISFCTEVLGLDALGIDSLFE